MGQLYNDALDDPLQVERVESFKGGINGFDRATLLGPDVSQDATNMTILENGRMRTRAGADKLSADVFAGGSCQGLFFYNTSSLAAGNIQYLVGGFDAATPIMKKWDGSAVTTAAGYVPTVASSLSMAQMVNLMYIADGTQHVYSWDGTTFTDLGTGAGNPPIASILVSHAGRMFASGIFSAPDSVYASALLTAAAGQWDNTNFNFRVGHGEGDPIVAMASMQDYYLVVLKRNSVYMLLTPPTDVAGTAVTTATQWQSRQLTNGIGCVGKRAWAVVENAIMFLAQDGIRAVSRVPAVPGSYEIKPPLSNPVQTYINRINWSAAATTCAQTYKQRVFFAVPLDTATQPSHVIVYNSDLNVWEGVWTGWLPKVFEVTRFDNKNQLVFGDTSGYVNQWKDTSNVDLATTYTDNGVDIPSSLTTRAFNGGENETVKTPVHLNAIFGNFSEGTVEIDAWLDETMDGTPYTRSLLNIENQLPVNLPFNLAIGKSAVVRQSMSDLDRYTEIYFELSQTRLKMEIVAFAMSFYGGPIIRE